MSHPERPPTTEAFATLAGPIQHEIEVKRSRFIANLTPITSAQEARELIAATRREHWAARHHCSAYIVGPSADEQRSSDDGEPAGTAGMPILEVLRRRSLTDTVAVVTRYFGGTLLGAAGLIRAYSGVVSAAVDLAPLVRFRAMTELDVRVPHSIGGRLDHVLRSWCAEHDALLGTPEYTDTVRFRLLVPARSITEAVAFAAEASSGLAHLTVGKETTVAVPPST